MSRDDTTTGDTLTGYPRKPQILGRQRVAQSRLSPTERASSPRGERRAHHSFFSF